jgi:hypothetical protein
MLACRKGIDEMDHPTSIQTLPLHLKAELALKRAVAKAILDHYQTGDALVIWRDGKVVHVPPEELVDYAREVLDQPLNGSSETLKTDAP